MASLYDLELQESNNFIHAIIANGETPALKLMKDQMAQASSMGEVGKQMLEQMEDETSEIGQSVKRLKNMEADIQAGMNQLGFAADLAKQANDIFSKSPETLEKLPENEQEVIKTYWLKKKSLILVLLQKGYNHQELFS